MKATKLGVMMLECLGACLSSVHSVYSNGQAQCKVCRSIRLLPDVTSTKH